MAAVGTSSGGLLASIVGHDLGMSTVVLEKARATIGGGTTYSGGTIWIPCNDPMQKMGISDTREEALDYIRSISMGRHDEAMAATYVDTGREMLRYVDEHTQLKMALVPEYTDYYADLPAGKKSGRKLAPDPLVMAQRLMEAEKDHPEIAQVRREPVPLFLGVPERMYIAGRALIAGLALSCIERGIDILMDTRARRLIVSDGRVIGLHATRQGEDFFVKANKGVLLATGGFEWNKIMNKRFMNVPDMHACTPPTNEGDGHIMGMEVGAATALMDHSLLVPTIRIPGEEIDGQPLYRLFMFSIGQPGNILVNREGRRCCDETFYPDVGRAFGTYDKRLSQFANVPIYWIADQSFRDRHIVGPLPMGKDMAEWLHRGDTLRELAEALGLPPANLEETVERFNRQAREGRDPDFHRGETIYDRWWASDPNHKPNPVLGPLHKKPFYGVQLHLGTVGNLGGLVTNPQAQVLDVREDVIPGLYATSNTVALLVMGFSYDSGLCQGKSMVFGYIAARHMAGKL